MTPESAPARGRVSPGSRGRGPGSDRREDGQVGVLVIGYLLVSLLVVTVVLAVSSVYIEHKKLLSAADGAALAAADDYSIDVGIGGGIGGGAGTGATTPLPALQDSGVEESAAGYLAATGAGARLAQLAVDPATGAPDGRTARVVLTAVVRPPIVNFLVPEGIPIIARADARAELTR
ncbi:pilus assembly protein TadG-related protein [Arthrobacter sp. B0490]|uniref:pilus assembly protein TadG-related protein n=1 Tax=Arthrobacter sp. B0490 TaxID=2058891 RepID=UPI000CE35AFF|nr:pilus assembly protein TadG-related protein [Arthrobacter sp. B0490]